MVVPPLLNVHCNILVFNGNKTDCRITLDGNSILPFGPKLVIEEQ